MVTVDKHNIDKHINGDVQRWTVKIVGNNNDNISTTQNDGDYYD